MSNKERLQEYLDKCGIDYIVDKRIKLNNVAYWGIMKYASFMRLVNKLGEDLDYVDVDSDYVLVKESDLIEKYGDPFNFDDFDVHGASPDEINNRLNSFDFDYDGLFIDIYKSPNMCFIRSNSIGDDVKDKLCNILNVDCDYKIGRLCDIETGLDLMGSGWFYFEV